MKSAASNLIRRVAPHARRVAPSRPAAGVVRCLGSDTHEDSIEKRVLEDWGTGNSAAADVPHRPPGLLSIQETATPPLPRRRRPFGLPESEVEALATLRETGDGRWRPPLSKIVATIGPSSEEMEKMQDIVFEGMRIMRLNFSHATFEEAELRINNLRECNGRNARLNRGNESLRAVLLDTRGPEIRSGKLAGDHDGKQCIELQENSSITLHTSDSVRDAGSTAKDIYIDYPNLASTVRIGSKILLDDGAISLTVVGSDVDTGTVSTVADHMGEIRSRAGVNLPGCITDLPPMSEKDKVDIRYGLSRDIDYIAASFIQDAAGVREIRKFCADVLYDEMKMDRSNPLPLIIAKIESVAALRNFDEILEAADGVMVARGDLGVEIPIQQVTNAQKEMIAKSNAAGKPVVVATQMLESMAKSPRPTRAEVADVTNAIYDGADAVMLSGETAKGLYPVETVKMMNEIILGAEQFGRDAPHLAKCRSTECTFVGTTRNISSVCKAAVSAAHEQNAAAIIVVTKYGMIPRFVAAHKPNCPIIAFCPTYKVGRQLQIHRGVHPIVGLEGLEIHERPAAAVRDAYDIGAVRTGDNIVLVMADKATKGCDRFISMRSSTVS